MSIDYSKLPAHMQESMRGYIEKGWRPGSFLQMVLLNDLTGAFAQADNTNIRHMEDWAFFMYNEAPSICWHSKDRIEAWIPAGGMEGLEKAAKEKKEQEKLIQN